MIRVTVDTNEIISAFNFGGRAIGLFRSAVAGEIEIAISQAIIDETLRVLRERFEWQPYRLYDLHQRLLKMCRLVEPKETLAVLADEPDNRIIECASEATSEYIITEDKPLLKIKQHAGIKVLNLAQFFDLLSARGRS